MQTISRNLRMWFLICAKMVLVASLITLIAIPRTPDVTIRCVIKMTRILSLCCHTCCVLLHKLDVNFFSSTKLIFPSLQKWSRSRRSLSRPTRTCSGTIQAMALLSASLTKCALMTNRSVPHIRSTMNTIGTRISFRFASAIALSLQPRRLGAEPLSSVSRLCIYGTQRHHLYWQRLYRRYRRQSCNGSANEAIQGGRLRLRRVYAVHAKTVAVSVMRATLCLII